MPEVKFAGAFAAGVIGPFERQASDGAFALLKERCSLSD